MDPKAKAELNNVKAFLEKQFQEEKAALHSDFKTAILFWTVVAFSAGIVVGFMLTTIARH